MSQRAAFVAYVIEQMGAPYIWGGKNPETGIDCSGVVAYAFRKAGGPDWRKTHNTDSLWNDCKEPGMIQPGTLCLYGGKAADDVSHVMVVISDVGSELVVVGASGGDSTTTSLHAAEKRGARVKVYKTHLYRADWRGFRDLPFPEEV